MSGRQVSMGSVPKEPGLDKVFTYGGITLGGFVGAYLPVLLFHVSELGIASIAGGMVGAFVGLWVGYRIYRYLDL